MSSPHFTAEQKEAIEQLRLNTLNAIEEFMEIGDDKPESDLILTQATQNMSDSQRFLSSIICYETIGPKITETNK